MEKRRPLLALSAVVCLAARAAVADPGGTVLLRARDAATGRPLAARADLGAGAGVELGERAAEAIDLPAEGALVAVRAPGHASLSHRLRHDGAAPFPVTFWLDAAAPAAPVPVAAGSMTVQGHVYDEETLDAIEGARVLVDGAGGLHHAVSDARGSFRVTLPAPPAAPDGRPSLGRVVIDAPGHGTRILEGIVLFRGGVARLVEDLPRGAGESREDITPMALRPAAEHALHQSAPAPAGDVGPVAALPSSPQDLVGMTPPASIAVGTGCSCTSCSGASIMSLEAYVGSGLDNEWISSWAAHSLRAGAVPYRSYGAWYVANPISGTYDICSTTCCQVWGSTAYGSTQSAGAITAGFMLERSGSLLRSEYSAENNALLGTMSCVNGDLSCGDGFAGSPSTGWSCLADGLCAGQDCFGHGRGECQWGTSRWANQGQLWNWITYHYYNDHGGGTGSRTAYPTSPITMPAFAPSPASVSPGDTFTIDVTAVNAAGLDHSEIMIGASLYAAATGYVSDPPNDTKVFLPVGTSNVSRPFVVPLATPGGTYDLLVSLYDDTDLDGAITGSDLSLLLATAPGAVTVVTCGAITLSPATLPAGTVGAPYGQQLTASGGTAPYGFAVTAGTLPPGISLSSGGLLSGTPTAAGSYPFTATATDASSCAGSRPYTLVVGATPAGNVVAGAGLGQPNPNRVRVFRGSGVPTTVDFAAYAAGAWGANVAAGDVSGAAQERILTGPGPGDQLGPQVRGFQRDGTPLGKVSFYAYGTLKFGVNVAAGSVDGDAFAEIATGPGPGVVFGPHVRGFNVDGATVTAMSKLSFFAYGTLRYGVNVAAGSVDADAFAEVVTGPGPGAVFGPQVRGFDYDAVAVTAIAKINFDAFTIPHYGAHVAAGSVDGDGYAELLAAPGPGTGSSFRSRFRGFDYDGNAVGPVSGFDVTIGSTSYGGRVGLGDVNGNAREELLAGLGRDPAAPAVVSPYAYGAFGLVALTPFDAFPGYGHGVNPAGGMLGF